MRHRPESPLRRPTPATTIGCSHALAEVLAAAVGPNAAARRDPWQPEPFVTVFAIFPDLTQLDFTGPKVLSRLPDVSETLVASVAWR